MTYQIKAIHLFNQDDERRTLEFRLNQINVITGKSGTGKTALIGIIEYCLGSSEFTVASGAIRNTVETYALELHTSDQVFLLARPAPRAGRKVSTRMHYSYGYVPENLLHKDVSPNTDSTNALRLFSEAIGIESNLTDVGQGTRSSFEVNIKHANYFTLQHQDEIANQSVLFRNQASEWVPQSIRDVLPYFLGAANARYLLDVRELRQNKRELRKVRQTVEEADALSSPPVATELIKEAVKLDLHPEVNDSSPAVIMTALRTIASISLVHAGNDSVDDEMASLFDEREELRLSLSDVRARRSAAADLMRHEERFGGEANEQKARLESLNLIPDLNNSSWSTCPLCSASHPEKDSVVPALKRHLDSLSSELSEVRRDTPFLKEAISSYDEELDDLAQQLRKNGKEIDIAGKVNEAIQHRRALEQAQAEIIGKAQLYSDSVSKIDVTSSSHARISQLEKRILDLEMELDQETVQERILDALAIISHRATAAAAFLKLEHSPGPVSLDISKLTVVVSTPEGRYPLQDIGSAENWLGYHLSLLIGMHSYFIRTSRPVPRFLFLDQPSQVYFPSERTDPTDEDLDSDDRNNLIRIYDLLRSFINENASGFQIIVTEHADLEETWFQDAVVERWRGSKALIPESWL